MATDIHRLNAEIYPLLVRKGLKATTMDFIAEALTISKRTLYEIYPDKKSMIKEVMLQKQRENHARFTQYFNTAEDVLSALILVFQDQARDFSQMCPSLLSDMDYYFPEVRRSFQESSDRETGLLENVFHQGVEQGVFRPDANVKLMVSLLKVQMEALKRMEDYLPKDITIVQAYRTITENLLRSLASTKGLEIIAKKLK